MSVGALPLEVVREIDDLGSAVMWALDLHDLPRYLDAFWPEAVFVERDGTGADRVLTGRDEIEADTAVRFAAPTGHQHRLANPRYRGIDAATVEVWHYYATSVVDPVTGSITIGSTGWLHDVLERRDGELRILRRAVGPWTGTMDRPAPGSPSLD